MRSCCVCPPDDVAPLEDVDDGVEAPLGVDPPPRADEISPSAPWMPAAGFEAAPDGEPPPPPEDDEEFDVLGVEAESLEPVSALEPVSLLAAAALRGLAAAADACSLQALVAIPFLPGGAPPGSGTHAFGFVGSVVVTPG
ncbi:MAG: hypothetical protein ACXVR0_04390 [Solirubrobacteraceae bacterium]